MGKMILDKVVYPVHPKESPMARASMLVAIAIVIVVENFEGSKDFSFSSDLRPPRIMRMPRKQSKPKAIQ